MEDTRLCTDPHATIELMGAAYTALSAIPLEGQRRALEWLAGTLHDEWRRREEREVRAALDEAEEAGHITSA